MSAATSPFVQSITNSSLLTVLFCEIFEHLVSLQALLNDPHHRTRRQASAVSQLLQHALNDLETRLEAFRPALANPAPTDEQAVSALAVLGTAMAAVRQVHLHLALLGARWPLGTADLFFRKLRGEGIAVPVPTLCVSYAMDDPIEDLGMRLADRLNAGGLLSTHTQSDTVLLGLPAAHLLDPLRWPRLVTGLAFAMVEIERKHGRLPARADEPGVQGESIRRLFAAEIAAKLVGQATYCAAATYQLSARLSGADDQGVAEAMAVVNREQIGADNSSSFFHGLLAVQSALHSSWGKSATWQLDSSAVDLRQSARDCAERLVGSPQPAEPAIVAHLQQLLADGVPINAMPLQLKTGFAEQLSAAGTSASFYTAIEGAAEQPASLAAILATGWRYKIEATYPLCRDTMAGAQAWTTARDALAGHVLERSSLLQQSIEAAHIHQTFARWRDA
jgi:hypothetical protein